MLTILIDRNIVKDAVFAPKKDTEIGFPKPVRSWRRARHFAIEELQKYSRCGGVHQIGNCRIPVSMRETRRIDAIQN
jgi:hypothetical protein